MQKTRMMRLAGVTALVLTAELWALIPAWGQSSPAKGMAGMGGTGNVALTKDIAAARVATAKYATNLDAAKADGYQILTKEIPGMGFHFVNPNISGKFDVTKPLLYRAYYGENAGDPEMTTKISRADFALRIFQITGKVIGSKTKEGMTYHISGHSNPDHLVLTQRSPRGVLGLIS